MIESNRDKPAIDPMSDIEIIDSLCTLIKLSSLEWKKLEIFYWQSSQILESSYHFKYHIDSLYMEMYKMLQARQEQTFLQDTRMTQSVRK